MLSIRGVRNRQGGADRAALNRPIVRTQFAAQVTVFALAGLVGCGERTITITVADRIGAAPTTAPVVPVVPVASASVRHALQFTSARLASGGSALR